MITLTILQFILCTYFVGGMVFTIIVYHEIKDAPEFNDGKTWQNCACFVFLCAIWPGLTVGVLGAAIYHWWRKIYPKAGPCPFCDSKHTKRRHRKSPDCYCKRCGEEFRVKGVGDGP